MDGENPMQHVDEDMYIWDQCKFPDECHPNEFNNKYQEINVLLF